MILYLDVPYVQKDKAKNLEAKCDPQVKKWYADTDIEGYVKFAKWILKDTDYAIIAIEYLHIIEGTRKCWKCGQSTKVIGLGVGEFIHIFGEDDDVEYEVVEDYVDPGEEIHLAWTDDESNIPPKLLEYLKDFYSVKPDTQKLLAANVSPIIVIAVAFYKEIGICLMNRTVHYLPVLKEMSSLIE